jgi:hypothetical protein
MGFLFFYQPFIHFHQRLGSAVRVDGLGSDRLIPFDASSLFCAVY